MAFATTDNNEITTVQPGAIETIYIAAKDRINAYLAERKELRGLYHYHSEKAARLEQAKRDANKVWLGQF